MKTRTNRGHRVVVTGVGLITPLGNDVATSWTGLVSGRSGAGPITQFDSTGFDVHFAAEVKGFDPEQYLERKEARRMDRFAQLAMAAAQQAMELAGLADHPAGVNFDRVGVIIGSGIGGIRTFEDQARTLVERGPSRISAFFVPMFIPDIAAGQVSMRFGARGPNYCTVSACASSAHAVGDSYRLIEHGDADVMIAGGTEASITPLTVAGFSNMKALSTRNESPATASRPFDGMRDGFVLGEGAGVLVLESLEHALGRGASILAEVIGFGQSADAYHLTAPAPEGAGAQLAMRAVLEGAGLQPADVEHQCARHVHTMFDRQDVAVVVFGEGHQPGGLTKSMTDTCSVAPVQWRRSSAQVCREDHSTTINFTARSRLRSRLRHNRLVAKSTSPFQFLGLAAQRLPPGPLAQA
jgi:3-oxoacyl-[acyl-carrier-protein] synthase II